MGRSRVLKRLLLLFFFSFVLMIPEYQSSCCSALQYVAGTGFLVPALRLVIDSRSRSTVQCYAYLFRISFSCFDKSLHRNKQALEPIRWSPVGHVCYWAILFLGTGFSLTYRYLTLCPTQPTLQARKLLCNSLDKKLPHRAVGPAFRESLLN